MGRYGGGSFRGRAKSLAESVVPPALPQTGTQSQTQSQAEDESLAQAKLEEQAAERLRHEQERQQELLRLQEAERAQASREQEKELQRQLDAETAANLRALQDAEAKAKAPIPALGTPPPAPAPEVNAEALLDEPRPLDAPQKSPELREDTVAEETLPEDLTRKEEDSRQKTPTVSPAERLAAAQAGAHRTAVALNAHVNNAAKGARASKVKTPAPQSGTAPSPTGPPSYAPPSSPSKGTGHQSPRAANRAPAPDVPGQPVNKRPPVPPADVHAAAMSRGARKLLGHVKVGRKVALEAYRHYSGKLKKHGSLAEADQFQFDEARKALAKALLNNSPPRQSVQGAGPSPQVPSKGGTPLPELYFSLSQYPEMAANILRALQAGHPAVLTYLGKNKKQRDANRRAALKNIRKLAGFSRDEYPFASSREGGKGSWVGHVPVKQQHAQGALLSQLIQKHNLKPGDQYRVVIIK